MSSPISSHHTGKSSTSRTASQARETSVIDAPVSSVMRWSYEIPERFAIWLTSLVVAISRRSRWRRMYAPNRSRSGIGK